MAEIHFLDNLLVSDGARVYEYEVTDQPVIVVEIDVSSVSSTTTYRMAKLDLETPEGLIEGRLASSGCVDRQAGGDQGYLPHDRLEIVINDTDLMWHRLADPNSGNRIIGAVARLRLGYMGAALSSFHTLAEYYVTSYSFSGLQFRIVACDRSSAYFERLPPAVQNNDPGRPTGYFPNAPVQSLGRTIPVIYGEKVSSPDFDTNERKGPIELIRVDGTQSGIGAGICATATFTVASHPMTSSTGQAGVIRIYEDTGSAVDVLDTAYWTAAAAASTASTGADNTLVTITRTGTDASNIFYRSFYADVGGRSNGGEIYTNPVDAILDILVNEACDASGNSVSHSQARLAEAGARARELGLVINYAITEPRTVGQWLDEICRTFNLVSGFDENGRYYAEIFSPQIGQAEYMARYNAIEDILEDSLSITPSSEIYTAISYSYGLCNRSSVFRGQGIKLDDAAASVFGYRNQIGIYEYRATDDANSAQYASGTRLASFSRQVACLRCDLPLRAAGHDLGSFVKLSTVEGPVDDASGVGYRDRIFQITRKIVDTDRFIVSIEAIDVDQHFRNAFYLNYTEAASDWSAADSDDRRYGYLCDADGLFPDGELGKQL